MRNDEEVLHGLNIWNLLFSLKFFQVLNCEKLLKITLLQEYVMSYLQAAIRCQDGREV